VIVQVVDQKRGAGIGASTAAAALGCHPFLSRIGLWLQLTGHNVTRRTGSEAEWGTLLEPVVRGYYAARHGYTGEHKRIVVPTESIYHPDMPWLRCTPDGICEEDYPDGLGDGSFATKLVQVKCPTIYTSWHWGHPAARSVPPHYRIQAVVEMAITGLPRVDFAVLCGGFDYFEVSVEHDAELEEVTLDHLRQFWRLVETRTEPDIDGDDDWRAYFADRLPRERFEIVADPSVEALMNAWRDAEIGLRTAQGDLDAVKNRILKVAVENRATHIKTDHGRVSVQVSKAGNAFVRAPKEWAIDKED